jgi:hypothetical protein
MRISLTRGASRSRNRAVARLVHEVLEDHLVEGPLRDETLTEVARLRRLRHPDGGLDIGGNSGRGAALDALDDRGVVVPALQSRDHDLVLFFHQPPNQAREIFVAQVIGVLALLRGQDRAPVEDVADHVGMAAPAVLCLDMENPSAVADVGVEPGDHARPRPPSPSLTGRRRHFPSGKSAQLPRT